MARLKTKVPVGPVSCLFTNCRPTLDIEVTGRLISSKDARSQSLQGSLRLEPAPGAFRDAITQHLLDTHPDESIEFDDGIERQIKELSHDEWDELFSNNNNDQEEEST